LHRVLLFYRERSGGNGDSAVDRLLVVGDSLDKQRVADVANETLGVNLRPMAAADVGLAIPQAATSTLTRSPRLRAWPAWRGKLVSPKPEVRGQNSGATGVDSSVFFAASDSWLLTCSALKH